VANCVVPGASDGTRAVCVWESDSVETIRNLVESAAGQISDNEYFEVNAENAQGSRAHNGPHAETSTRALAGDLGRRRAK
jgi:hypothetical protein